MTDPQLTIDLRNQPAAHVGLTMHWRDLLFLHYAYDAQAIQQKLPPGLTVDTFPDETGTEMAWIGLVPFRMEGVKPVGLPHLGPLENFPETNVRTYCHVDGKDPGVWFFSLDAANPFAVAWARAFFHLNYRNAKMSVERSGDEVHYESCRCVGPGETSVHCSLGEPAGTAQPGTLEFFLVERYVLYSYKGGRLFKGQVFHQPYTLQSVRDYRVSSSLLEVDGLDPRAFSHAVFSSGVDVSAGRITRVE